MFKAQTRLFNSMLSLCGFLSRKSWYGAKAEQLWFIFNLILFCGYWLTRRVTLKIEVCMYVYVQVYKYSSTTYTIF
jgi:hypothetical protein